MIFQHDTPINRLLNLAIMNGGGRLVEETVTGNPVSFETDVAKPLKGLLIHFTPVQSGTGDPSPSNVRPISGWTGVNITHAGKNLLDNSDLVNMAYSGTSSSQNVRPLNKIPVKPGAKMVWTGLAVSEKNIRFYDVDGNYQSSYTMTKYSGETFAFTVPDDSYFILPKWYRSGSDIPISEVVASNPIIEYGEEPTAYEPYIEPEVHHIVFPAQGKNLYDGQFPSLSANMYYRHYFVGDSEVTGSSNVPLSAQGYGNIFLLPGKVNTGASTGGNNITEGVSRTVTPVDGWVTVAYRNNYDVNPSEYNVQIEVGSYASEYEPYTNTVYGGTLDALTGVLTVNYVYAALSATGKNANETYFYTTCQPLNIPVIKELNVGLVCNRLKNSPNVSESETESTISCYANGIIRWHDTEYMDLTAQEYNAAVASDPVVIAYEIKEPYTVQLDPVTLSTLKGTNTMWTDTNGTNEITYMKKG